MVYAKNVSSNEYKLTISLVKSEGKLTLIS